MRKSFRTEYFIIKTTPIAATICCTLAESKAQAPVKINVTVLKGDPAASGSFSGVFFGSGAGVEWVKEEDE
jgi:hypothetical protein